jgi:hypothetical protein
MRLYNYLNLSGFDEKTNKFRLLSIKLIDKKTSDENLVDEVCKKYNIKYDGLNSILAKINKELSIVYKGKYHFGYCSEEPSLPLNTIKLNKKYYKKLVISLLNANEELNLIKLSIENLHSTKNMI